jgi:hypothetical protein
MADQHLGGDVPDAAPPALGAPSPGGSAEGRADIRMPEAYVTRRYRRAGEAARRERAGMSARANTDHPSDLGAAVGTVSTPAELIEALAQAVAFAAPSVLPGLVAALAALQGAVAARLVGGPRPGGPAALLTAAEVGARLGLRVAQVYRRADRWPFTRRLGPKTVRFDSAGLESFLGRSVKP